MIRNQRPYQLMYSKTGNKIMSMAVAVCARCCGRLGFFAGSLRKRKAESLNDLESSRQNLEKLCPKPKPDETEWTPMAAPEEAVDLSVIVPVHNAEKYIEDCVESILNQSDKYRIQVILVNDGSTDQTAKILERYRGMPDVLVIDFHQGGSAAKARNEGILHAVGEYLMFVDSDDMLRTHAVEVLMEAAKREDADVVQGGWQYIDENGGCGPVQIYEECVYTGRRRADCLDLPGMPWGKVYRRELFSKIRFPSNYTCFEDTIIHFLIFRKAQRIVSIQENVYLWRKNSTGITSMNQGRPSAVQGYWIVEEMLERDRILGLSHDQMFLESLTMQLSNYCYANLRGLDEVRKRDVFRMCCALYQNNQTEYEKEIAKLPYAVRCGAKALRMNRYDLWCSQGRLFQLMN
ncbi:glycosyltransferase family 2 protein [Brotaphodocola sp.]|uniref:glycosyltransferase family 2 protein n=1 Tax=Brotaphodocola sp. TaxID=3073577 RepID=UPI003D7E6A60